MTDPEIMWDWIRAYGVPFYETFWQILGMKEYRFIYKVNFEQEIADILRAAGLEYNDEIQNTINDTIQQVKKDAGIHYGHPEFNTATMAGIYRMAAKRIAAIYGVAFPINREKGEEPATPWWAQRS